MTLFKRHITRILRTSALYSIVFFALLPTAHAFNPNEGAEPLSSKRPKARLPSLAPVMETRPKLYFPPTSSAPAAIAPSPGVIMAAPVPQPMPSEAQLAPSSGNPDALSEAKASLPPLPPPPAPITTLAAPSAPPPLPSDASAAAASKAEPEVVSVPALPPLPLPAPVEVKAEVAAPAPVAEPKPEPLMTTAPLPAPTKAESAPDSTPATMPEKLSDETKRIASHVPSKIDTPVKPKPSKKVAVKRMAPEIEPLASNPKVETFDSAGLSIKVSRPGLDTNYELTHAYNALMGGNTSEAIEVYKNIISAEPENEDALFGLAATYHRVGDIEHARPYYSKLLKVNPSHREGLNNFLTLMGDESPEEALAELDRLEQRNPDFSPIPAQQGVLLSKLGYTDQAREKLLRAIDLAPENLTYKYNLAIIMDRSGRYADAAALYRLLIDASLKGSKIPAPLDTLQRRLNFIATTASAPALPQVPAGG